MHSDLTSIPSSSQPNNLALWETRPRANGKYESRPSDGKYRRRYRLEEVCRRPQTGETNRMMSKTGSIFVAVKSGFSVTTRMQHDGPSMLISGKPKPMYRR